MAHELNQHIKIRNIDHFVAEKADMIATVLKGTHGRERVCALIQYSFDVYFQCMSTSNELWNHTHWSANASLNVRNNVSSSRKMLKFL